MTPRDNNIPESHNCNCTDETVELALDGALTRQQTSAFEQQVQDCPACREKLEKEKSFREFLHNKVPRRHASQKLISSIRDQIRGGRL